jgi:4,5-dihydroxyphthalate decarboxylase
VKLRCSFVPSALTKPIIEGLVTDPELQLEISTGTADPNSRRMIAGELDFAEMSLATCVQAFALGSGFVAMPVFMSRRFLHSCVLVDPAASIRLPADLAGKRIGIPQYWATSSVWHRALLNHEYGVASTAVTWVALMPERLAGYPPGVQFRVDSAPTLGELLRLHAVDAVMEPRPASTSTGTRLFPDPVAAAFDYYDRTGVYPVIHTVALQRATHDAYPELYARIRDLLERAKTFAYTHYPSEAFDSPIDGLAFAAWRERMSDPFPYGLAPNAPSLEAFLDLAVEQGLTTARVRVEDIFSSEVGG